MRTDVFALVGGGSGPTQQWAVVLISLGVLGIVAVWIRRFIQRK